MDATTPSKQTGTSPLRHWPKRILFLVACLATLVALFYTVENWRGKRAWEQCRRELVAKGANLDWKSFVPGPVADDQNIFKAPHMSEWFAVPQMTEWFLKGNYTPSNQLKDRLAEANGCLVQRSTNLIARVSVVAPGTPVAAQSADVVVPESLGTNPHAPAEAREQVRQALHRAFSLSNSPPSLQGAKSYRLFAQPWPPASPLRVVLLASNSPNASQISALFPRTAFGTLMGANATIRVDSSGPGSFEVYLGHPHSFGAADYLACTDALLPEFEVMQALRRPVARLEGDYEDFFAMPIPNFMILRDVAQTVSQRAQCYLLLGRPEEALREATLLHKLSRLLDSKPTTLISAMMDVAFASLFTSVVADGLRLHGWQEPQLEALQLQLGEIHLLLVVMQAFETEVAGSCHTLATAGRAELCDIINFSKQKRSLSEKLTDPGYLLLRYMPRGWLYQNMVTGAISSRTFFEAADVAGERMSPRRIEELNREAMVKFHRFPAYSFLAAVAVPNLVTASQTMASRQTMVKEALIACAVERYRLARGDYPPTLDALSPQFIGKIPADVIDGQALHYRRTDNGRFLLYSVGWNETDDGGIVGKSNTDGDWVWQ